MRDSKPLQLLGLLSSMLLVLVGCGGSSSGGAGGSTTRVSHITVQISRSNEVVSTARNQGSASAQVRQVQSGEAAFIQRLEIRVQNPTQGADLLAPQTFPLGPADQDTVTLDVMLPDPLPTQFQILVSAFNNFNNRETKIFLGQTLIQRGQDSATITLVRNPDPTTLIPVAAVPDKIQQTVFTFTDGAVFGFGLGGAPVTLAAGSFQGNTGDFTLASGGFMANGQMMIGSCFFTVTASTFALGRGPQAGDRITFDPCQVDAIDGRLTATNASLNISATSGVPVSSVPPTGVLVLPSSAPTLVTDADTSGTVSIGAALAGSRPGGLTFAITQLPAHGTAVVNNTGLVTYRPATGFNGSDSLVVTVTATFTDGNSPPLVLGTVPLAITVRGTAVTPPAPVRVDDSTSNTITVLDLVSVFRDADTLTLTVSNNTNPSLVATTLVGTTLTLRYQPRQHGSAVITVRATDQSGLFADTSFTVTVDRTFPFILGLNQLGDPFQHLSDSAN